MEKIMYHFDNMSDYFRFLKAKPVEPKKYVEEEPKEEVKPKRKKKKDEVLQAD